MGEAARLACWVILGTSVILFFGVVGSGDFEAEKAAEREYCENVQAWRHDLAGHPDYRGIYDEVCSE